MFDKSAPGRRFALSERLEVRRLLTTTVYDSSQTFASLVIGAGDAVVLQPNGDHFIHTDQLSIAPGGKLDLNDNDLIVAYSGESPYTQVRDWALGGYSATPDATKSGIVSTLGQNANGHTHLALFDNAFLGASEWPLGSGNAVPADTVLGKYTWFGDLNFDGQVTGDDYSVVDANLNSTPASGTEALSGDANDDRIVSGDDYGVIDANLGKAKSFSIVKVAAVTPSASFKVADKLYLVVDDGSGTGAELWVSDDTEAGTQLVKDINPGPAGSGISQFIAFDGKAFFIADDGTHGAELWCSDGTPAGTFLVKDVKPGAASSVPAGTRPRLATSNGLFFSADDGVNGFELWCTDGTEANTRLVKPVAPDNDPVFTWSIRTVFGDPNYAYFTLNREGGSRWLWRSDGTADGTFQISPDLGEGGLQEFHYHNGITYFSRYLFSDPDELWRTDGTIAGTFLVASAGFNKFASVGNIFFAAGVLSAANLLYSTDGTPGGTYTQNLGGSIQDLVAFNGVLYFIRGNAELWRSDGTPAGTFLVDTLPGPPAAGATPRLIATANALLIKASSPATGLEIFVTDGSAGGIHLLKDINPGIAASINQFTGFIVEGSQAFFAADNGQLLASWTTDGTADGTVMYSFGATGLSKRIERPYL